MQPKQDTTAAELTCNTLNTDQSTPTFHKSCTKRQEHTCRDAEFLHQTEQNPHAVKPSLQTPAMHSLAACIVSRMRLLLDLALPAGQRILHSEGEGMVPGWEGHPLLLVQVPPCCTTCHMSVFHSFVDACMCVNVEPNFWRQAANHWYKLRLSCGLLQHS